VLHSAYMRLIAGVGMVDTGSDSTTAHTAAQRTTHSAYRNSSSSSGSHSTAMRLAVQMSRVATAAEHNSNGPDADDHEASSSESSVDSHLELKTSSQVQRNGSSSGMVSSSAAKAASSTNTTTDWSGDHDAAGVDPFGFDNGGSVHSGSDSNDAGTRSTIKH
jgi:hypothetical protein